MICSACQYKRNCINGSWCTKKRVYVEHKVINQCDSYGTKKES